MKQKKIIYGAKTFDSFKGVTLFALLFFIGTVSLMGISEPTIPQMGFCMLWLLDLVVEKQRYISKYINSNLFIIILFSAVYCFALRRHGQGGLYLLSQFVAPASFYTFGIYLSRRLCNEQIIVFFLVILSFIIVAPLYNTLLDTKDNGFINYNVIIQSILDFEQDSYFSLPITLVSLPVGLCFTGLIMSFQKDLTKIQKWLFLFLFICALYYNIHYLRRSGLFVCFLCILVMMYHEGRKTKYITYTAFLAIALLIIVGSGTFLEVLSSYEERAFQDGGLQTGNQRYERWGEALSLMFKYPMGWKDRPVGASFVHNMWLDCAQTAGIIPFILLTIISIKGIIVNYKLFKFKRHDITLLTGLHICFVVAAFAEPVIEGMQVFFDLYLLLIGAMVCRYNQLKFYKNRITTHKNECSYAKNISYYNML